MGDDKQGGVNYSLIVPLAVTAFIAIFAVAAYVFHRKKRMSNMEELDDCSDVETYSSEKVMHLKKVSFKEDEEDENCMMNHIAFMCGKDNDTLSM